MKMTMTSEVSMYTTPKTRKVSQYALRLPSSMLDEAKRSAGVQGISLNTWLLFVISRALEKQAEKQPSETFTNSEKQGEK